MLETAKQSDLPLASQRRLEILSQLQEAGAVRVASLATRFGVADETIRRDLDKLSDQGQLARTHGGAISIRHDRVDLPMAIRKNRRAAEKQQIANQALELINPNDVIGLDASTTVLELACLIPDMPLTVVTNSLDVIRLLADRPQIEVICSGGEFDPKSMCLFGPLAEANIQQIALSKLFFSCKGIDFEHGYSEASTHHASLKRVFLQQAEQSILLADSSKFGVRSMVSSGKLDLVDLVITDESTGSDYLESLQKRHVQTEVASPRSSAQTDPKMTETMQ
ncbi:MAG: DeoR/GlpR family DNA-binding transcription regulator [Lacipirellulaceae bacterium]